jgi:phospholipid/cholesterol/gamma-HCH transport system substrate-binding protein
VRGLGPTLVKSAIFVIVTVLATGVLLITISSSGAGGTTYTANFSDVTALATGDDVRMAGVRVGEITKISVVDRDEALVHFTVRKDIRLASTVTAAIKFKNLVGQRYLDIDQGTGSPESTWPASRTLGMARTTPALDLTALFNGFQPLFEALNPGQVNQLSYEIIQIFQGQGTTVTDLLAQTASLTTTLADKDQVIGEVIDNLNNVLTTVDAHDIQLGTTIDTLQQLVSGLSSDRQAIGSAITGIGSLTTSVSGLLQNSRQPLAAVINSLGALSGNLEAGIPALQSFLQNFPNKVNNIGRTASYGSWVNAYVCTLTPVTADGKTPSVPAYVGGVGIKNPAARCTS